MLKKLKLELEFNIMSGVELDGIFPSRLPGSISNSRFLIVELKISVKYAGDSGFEMPLVRKGRNEQHAVKIRKSLAVLHFQIHQKLERRNIPMRKNGWNVRWLPRVGCSAFHRVHSWLPSTYHEQ